jgi:hypothetical protein
VELVDVWCVHAMSGNILLPDVKSAVGQSARCNFLLTTSIDRIGLFKGTTNAIIMILGIASSKVGSGFPLISFLLWT